MENIEAMLCAYIEGDLDEAGRAQIEKHLQENPQHRKLMAELVAMRELVQALPRVKAPLDVGESLRGQVERSMLLDDSNSAGPGSARANRLPQFFAIAAILLLCASLCLVLYKALGPTMKRPVFTENVASKVPEIKISDDAAGSAAIPTTQELVADDVRTAKDHATLQESQQLATQAPLDEQRPAMTVIQQKVAALAQFDIDSIRHRLQNSGYGVVGNSVDKAAPVLMVVNSSNPPATNVQVTQFLSNNSGISWKLVPADAEVKSNPTTLPSGSFVLQQKAFGGTDASAAPMGLDDKGKSNSDVAVPATQPASDVYVARGLTLLQADALRQSLSDQQNGADVQVTVQSAVVLATTQPSAVAKYKDDKDLGGANSLATESPTTAPSEAANINGDIVVPTTAPSNSVLAGEVGVSPPAPGAVLSAGNGRSELNGPMAISSKSDRTDNSQSFESVDAVIVVQSASAAIPQAGAATQPDLAGEVTSGEGHSAVAPPATQPSPSTQP